MTNHTVTLLAAVVALASAPLRVEAELSTASRIAPGGVGPIAIGATPRQAGATGTAFTATQPAVGSSCHYLRPSAPAGLTFLVENGTIRRAEVRLPTIATTDGFRVGDRLAQVTTHYGSRAHLTRGKYDPAEQSVSVDGRGGEAKFRLVFTGTGGIVRTIFAGALPQIAYVEGCS